MRNLATKNIHLTLEQFDDQLETCLLIIEEPSPRNPYYVCEHTPTKTIVHVYIKKLTL